MLDAEFVLTRGVAEILPSKDALKRLMDKRKITLYQGFDPSSPNLHLGNLIGIRKLAQFQKLGHKVIFLIGDFTGMIGDPTDKKAARKKLTKKQVIENAKDYRNQIEKILTFDGENKAELKYNSNWLSKLNFEDVVELASNFTTQQMLERDFFQLRLKKQKPIYLHEFLYPLMQGYDSVAMNVDLEIGGNDQLFNMIAGRSLIKSLKNKEKYVLTMKLLTDTSGEKMGKSIGNVININDNPAIIYRAILKLPEELLPLAIELLTDLPIDLVNSNLQQARIDLAFSVVSQLFGEREANLARNETVHRFREGLPTTGDVELPEPSIQKTVSGTISLASGYPGQNQLKSMRTGSISDAKRLINQGAVTLIKENVQTKLEKDEKTETLKIKAGDFIRVGESIIAVVKDIK